MSARSRPRLVVFDFDDVLVESNRDLRVQAIARSTGASPATVIDALFKSGLEARNHRGELGLEDYLDTVRKRFGLVLPEDDFIDACRQGLRLRYEVLGLAETLAQQTTFALFANGGEWLGKHLPKFFPELRPLFGTRMITSAQLGLTKPDPQAFFACLSTLGFSTGSSLMIDDRAEHAAGAREAGLDAIHYLSPAQLASELMLRGFDLEPVHAP